MEEIVCESMFGVVGITGCGYMRVMEILMR